VGRVKRSKLTELTLITVARPVIQNRTNPAQTRQVRNKKDAVAHTKREAKRDSDTPGVRADRRKYDAARKKAQRKLMKDIAIFGRHNRHLLQLRSLPTIDKQVQRTRDKMS
jgi:hypothetical protein